VQQHHKNPDDSGLTAAHHRMAGAPQHDKGHDEADSTGPPKRNDRVGQSSVGDDGSKQPDMEESETDACYAKQSSQNTPTTGNHTNHDFTL